jgi:hypothetical protein
MGPHSFVETLISDVCKEMSPDKIFCTLNTAFFFTKAAFPEKYYAIVSLVLFHVYILRYFAHRSLVNEPDRTIK